jgi:hypothetical protein
MVDDGAGPSVFNTGQIVFGLVRAAREFGGEAYGHAAQAAARWLVRVQDPTGEWRRHDFLEQSHVYNTRTAWALLLMHEQTGEEELREAARSNLAWALSQGDEDGFYRRAAFDPREQGYSPGEKLRAVVRGRNRPSFYTKASLHTLAYTVQGALESAWLLEDAADLAAHAQTAAERLAFDARDGGLAGFYGPGWRRETSSACLTGAAQMAIVWLRLVQNGRRELLDAADRAIGLVAGSQDLSARRPHRRGAVAGSKPLWGLYLPFRYPNWAAKFAADAYLLRLAVDTGADMSDLAVW